MPSGMEGSHPPGLRFEGVVSCKKGSHPPGSHHCSHGGNSPPLLLCVVCMIVLVSSFMSFAGPGGRLADPPALSPSFCPSANVLISGALTDNSFPGSGGRLADPSTQLSLSAFEAHLFSSGVPRASQSVSWIRGEGGGKPPSAACFVHSAGPHGAGLVLGV